MKENGERHRDLEVVRERTTVFDPPFPPSVIYLYFLVTTRGGSGEEMVTKGYL